MSTVDTSTWNPDPALNESIGDIPLNSNASIAQTWQAIQMLMAAGGLHGLQLVTFDGATASADGKQGLVPAPEAGDQDKVLKGDGTWDTLSASDIPNIDASKITSGTIDIARLPAGALERLVTVADQTARYALTTADVQLGDTVKQLDTGIMYIVVDTSKLGQADGYVEFSAGSATSVPWSGVTDKPSTFPPSSHSHGNLTNDGKIGSTANLPLITTTSGKVTTGSFGSAANTFCQGNDSRLSDSRTPKSHTHGNITNAGAIGSTSGLPVVTGANGVLQAGSFGATAGTVCEGNDSRLSDARTPTSHTHGSITNDGKLGTASRVVVTDGSKVIGVSSITTTKLGYLTDVTANIQGQIDGKADSATTLVGYGITDAKIASGTITLGSNTITPLTSASSLNATKLTGTASVDTTGKAATAGTADKVANKLTLKLKSGSTEGTDLYTYDGSGAKTLDIKQGSNITLSAASGQLTIAGVGDTKNTAGSTDSSSKLFLIGATSQAANPQTYSHDTAYVGTDGCLYSGGTKVLTAHQDISGKADDSSVVHKTGNEIIAGYKTFTSTIQNKHSSYAIGDPYSSNVYLGFDFRDKNGAELGDILYYLNTTDLGGDACLELRVFENPNHSEPVFASLGVHSDAHGNTFAMAPTPSSSEDDSDKIATTAWVRDATGNFACNAATATEFSANKSVALTGDVTGSTSSKAGWSVATTLANSGVTAGSYGPSANATPAYGATFDVPYITVDAKGRITAASTKTVKIPASDNTNTDTLMTQNVSTSNSTYPILAVATANASADLGAKTGIFGSGVKLNPSTSEITATRFLGAVKADKGTGSYVNSIKVDGALITGIHTQFGAIWNAPTKSYRVACATYPTHDEKILWYSITNANVTNSTNTVNKSMSWDGGTGALTTASFSGDVTNCTLGTASRAVVTDSNKKLAVSSVTSTELGYVSGVTSAIQTQLNAKAPLASPALTGTPTSTTAALGTNSTQIATTAFVYENAIRIRNADTTIYVAQSAAGNGSGSSAANAMSTDNMWKYLASVRMTPASGSRDNSRTLTIKFVPNGTTSYGNITFDANKMPGVRNLTIDTSTGTASTTSNYTTNCPTFGNVYVFGGPLHVTIKNINATGTIQAEYHGRIIVNTFAGAARFVASTYGRLEIGSGIYAIKHSGTDYLVKGTEYGQIIVSTKTANFHFMELCYFTGGIYISDAGGRCYVRHDYIKLTGTQPVVTCTASGTKTATCSTAAGTAAKVGTLVEGQTFTLTNNAVAYVTFDNTNTAANPTLNINGTGAKPIYFNGAAIPANYLNKHVQYKFTYNGTQFVCNNTFQRVEVATTHSYFTRNGAIGTTYNSGSWNWSGFSTSFTNGANVAGTVYGSLSGNASTATKATQDGSGNTITSYYCTLSTDQTISGVKTFSAAKTVVDGDIARSANTGELRLSGGANASTVASGANLCLYGSSRSSDPGLFILSAGTSTAAYTRMIGKPDGTLTWGGQAIQTSSDERLKTSLSPVPDDVLDAWEAVGWGEFQYLDAVERKGEAARLHLGLIAQRVKDAFEARGLDACEYGILCYEEEEDLWMVRYTEALAMEAACQRRRADRLEARIKALEERLK